MVHYYYSHVCGRRSRGARHLDSRVRVPSVRASLAAPETATPESMPKLQERVLGHAATRQLIGIEREAEYLEIAKARISAVAPLFTTEAV